jgi:hypothetical protein
MVNNKHRSFASLLLPFALVVIGFSSAQTLAQKARETVAYNPPTLSLAADPAVVTASDDPSNPAVIQLNAVAASPDGNPIRYAWRVAAGRLAGDGASVKWDVSGLTPGTYRAYVDIDTGTGEALCHAFSTTAVVVNRRVPPPPSCPTVRISCPENTVAGAPVDFSATISGGTPSASPAYNWVVSAGTIVSGQGTNSIRVDTTGLAGQSVTATLSMGGYSLDCSDTCTIQFPAPIECRKFDEFPDIARNDEKARLDNFVIDLQNDPSSTGYVIVHPGTKGRPDEVQKHTSRVTDYLVNSRGMDGRRIVTLVGSPRPELMVELWTCPQGAKSPPNR